MAAYNLLGQALTQFGLSFFPCRIVASGRIYIRNFCQDRLVFFQSEFTGKYIIFAPVKSYKDFIEEIFFYLIALVFVGKVSVLEILLLTLSSSLLYLGQTGSLLKESNLFRHAGGRQRVSQRLDRILTKNMPAEVFLHIKTESWEAQSSSFCCPGKDSAQRRDGELFWEESTAFTQENPPLRWSISTSRHTTAPHPSPVLKWKTQEHKTSSGGSGLAFLSFPTHYFASPISQVHNLYQQWNKSHEKVQGVAGTSGPHTAHATVS